MNLIGDYRRGLSFFLLLLFILSTCILAQSTASGTIEGYIRDESGAIVPGASITIRNMETNATRSLVSDDSGGYRAVLLPPGMYEVTCAMSGFATIKRTDVRLEVGFTASMNFQLKVSSIAETVTVTGEAPIVEPTRSEMTSTVGERAVANLPINGRRWENFVLLTPGVVEDGNYGLVSYRGVSGLYNNNTIDGADNNQAFFSEARGRTRVVYTISQASVREFQVGLSNFSAEFGRAGGGTVNAVTKSGTNEFHGEGFYFLRDAKFMAREPFTPTKPPERRQQVGLSFGMPFIKDKLFFFGNYDQQIRSFPIFANTSSATFLTSSCTSPGCAATIDFFKSLNIFSPRKANNLVALGKVDYIISYRNNLMVSYNWHRWRSPNGIQTQAVVSVAESANGHDGVETDFLNVRLNTVVTPKIVNEARFQWGRDFEFQRPNAPGPGVSITGGISFGMPNYLPRPAYPNEKRMQWTDNVSWQTSRHTFKAGMDINYVREIMINLYQGGGIYSYSNLNNMASDCPKGIPNCTPRVDGANTGKHYSNYQQAFDLRGMAGRVFFTTTDFNFYVQDTYKPVPNVTLNMGLRYEFQKMPKPFQPNPAFPETASLNQDRNNAGPRLGFSWDIDGKHLTVVRAGYGMSYARTSNSAISNAFTNNGTVFASYYFTPTSAGSPAYPAVLAAPPASGGSKPDVQMFANDYVQPLSHQFELSIDRQLFSHMNMAISYLMARTLRLPQFRDINMPAATGQVFFEERDASGNRTAGPYGPFPLYLGARPNAIVNRILLTESVGNSNYNGMVLHVNRRFDRGVQFSASFTVAKALDDGQTSTTFFASYPTLFDGANKKAEYGRSNFDVRKRFVTNFLYEPQVMKHLNSAWSKAILGGFKFSGIVILSDGFPVTGTISGSLPSTWGAVNTSSPNGTGGSLRVPYIGRNNFTRPGRATVDFRLAKDFRISESKSVSFFWEAFNLFNHTNYSTVSTTQFAIYSTGTTFDAAAKKGTVALTPDTGFLIPRGASTTTFGPRDMQFAFKFKW